MTPSAHRGAAAAGFLRILVAYDGSDRAEDALALALRLREPEAGSLTLVCVRAHRRPWDGIEESAPAHDEDVTSEGVEAMLTEARHRVAPGVHIRTRELLAGSATAGLAELAETEADLIVVGSSRHAAFGGVSLERTAGRLLHGVACAVAIPPAGHRSEGPFRHIGVAFDDSSEARTAVGTAYALAARDGATVTIMQALPSPVEPPSAAAEHAAGLARRRAQDELDAVAGTAPEGVIARTMLRHGAPETLVKETCNGSVDLLITGSRGLAPLRSAFVGSVSDALVEGAPHPVLVIPRPPERPESVGPAVALRGVPRTPAAG